MKKISTNKASDSTMLTRRQNKTALSKEVQDSLKLGDIRIEAMRRGKFEISGKEKKIKYIEMIRTQLFKVKNN